MGWRNDQCRKVCRIIDDSLANRPTERDSLIVAVQKAFNALEQPETNCSEIPNNSDTISRQAAIDALDEIESEVADGYGYQYEKWRKYFCGLPSVQPERKTGHWILDRSGAYCCSKCMEPCAGYVMMKPRDKFCKMCGAKMDGGE